MIIEDKMRNYKFFSANEREVIEFILTRKTEIEPFTAKDIAKLTYTSPSTLYRIAHKLGYESWNDLKKAFLKEQEYLHSHLGELDANLPFSREDDIITVAHKIGVLKQEAMKDTLSLLVHEELQKAVGLLAEAVFIHIYAVSQNLLVTEKFMYDMNRIGGHVTIHSLQGDMHSSALLLKKDSCAVIVSYSGETEPLVHTAEILKHRRVPMIALTNIGESRLSRLADVNLRLCTREKMYSKIGNYTTDASITLILDILYSCYFQRDYDKNLQLRITSEGYRQQKVKYSTTEILREGQPPA